MFIADPSISSPEAPWADDRPSSGTHGCRIRWKYNVPAIACGGIKTRVLGYPVMKIVWSYGHIFVMAGGTYRQTDRQAAYAYVAPQHNWARPKGAIYFASCTVYCIVLQTTGFFQFCAPETCTGATDVTPRRKLQYRGLHRSNRRSVYEHWKARLIILAWEQAYAQRHVDRTSIYKSLAYRSRHVVSSLLQLSCLESTGVAGSGYLHGADQCQRFGLSCWKWIITLSIWMTFDVPEVCLM